MNIQLHCASYEVKAGMYKGLEVEFNVDALEQAGKDFHEYYKGINVEEYLLADAWCDDSDAVQAIVQKCYGESLGCFLNSLKEIIEDLKQSGCEDVDNIDGELLKYALDNTGIENIGEELESLSIHEDIDEIYDEIVETHESETGQKLPDAVVMAFRWLGTDGKFNFMQAQGYGVFYLAGGRCLYNRNY